MTRNVGFVKRRTWKWIDGFLKAKRRQTGVGNECWTGNNQIFDKQVKLVKCDMGHFLWFRNKCCELNTFLGCFLEKDHSGGSENQVFLSISNPTFSSSLPPVKQVQVNWKCVTSCLFCHLVSLHATQSSKAGVCLPGSPSGHAMVTAAAWWVVVSSLGSYLHSRTRRYTPVESRRVRCPGSDNV